MYVYVYLIYITCIQIFLDRFYLSRSLLNLVTSLSSFPLNDVENDPDVSLTVSDRRASLLLDSEITCAKIDIFLKNKVLTIVSYSEKHAFDCWITVRISSCY